MCVYRPPGDKEPFLDEFQTVLEDLFLSTRKLFLCGDFNLHMNKEDDPDANRFLLLLDSLQLSYQPTGPTHRLGNQLDLILHRNLQLATIKTLDLVWADHALLLTQIQDWTHLPQKSKHSTTQPNKIFRRNLKLITPQNFHDWWYQCTHPDLPVTELDAIFHAKLSLARNVFCPLHLVREKPPQHLRNKWFSPELNKMRIEGRRLQRTYNKSKNREDQARLLRHLKRYKLATKYSKKIFVQSQLQKPGNTLRHLFKISSSLSGTIPSKQFLPANPQQYCEDVASYFISKVADIRRKVDAAPPSQEESEAHTSLETWERLGVTLPWQATTNQSPSAVRESQPPPSFSTFREVSQVEVEKALLALGPSSSLLDPLPTSVLKSLSKDIVPDLTTMINKSLTTGLVPKSWKRGVVTPLLKKADADPTLPQNLRPVTQLRILPRLTEHFVTKQVQDHVEDHTILHDAQSGFRPGRGTELATADVRENLLWCADRSHPALLILLDLSAAFDTVDHDILLQQLKDIAGIEGCALEWFKSFLSDRVQAVRWGDHLSEELELPWGVPQGSALSPLLFNLYMRPLASLLERVGLRFQMYADDTQILVDLHQSAGERERITTCLALVGEWMRNNKLCLNSAKTELLVVRGGRDPVFPSIPWPLSWGPPPTPVTKSRDLGVIISHTLDGVAHAATTVKTCHHKLNILAKLFPLLDLNHKKHLYQAFIGSRISYGLAFMTGASQRTLFSLQKVQNRAIRLIFGLNRKEHLSEWRLRLGWLSVKDLLTSKIGAWMWKARRKQGPRYIHRWAIHPSSNRARRTAQEDLLLVPRFHKVKKGGSTLACKGARIWNSLPFQVRSAGSFILFKKGLKKFLLDQEATRLANNPAPQSSNIEILHPSGEHAHPGQPSCNDTKVPNLPAARPLNRMRHPIPSGSGTFGLSSPPLPRRDNLPLFELAKRNKQANLQTGSYQPRRL